MPISSCRPDISCSSSSWLSRSAAVPWRVFVDPPHIFAGPGELFLPWGEIIESDETNNAADGPSDCTIP